MKIKRTVGLILLTLSTWILYKILVEKVSPQSLMLSPQHITALCCYQLLIFLSTYKILESGKVPTSTVKGVCTLLGIVVVMGTLSPMVKTDRPLQSIAMMYAYMAFQTFVPYFAGKTFRENFKTTPS